MAIKTGSSKFSQPVQAKDKILIQTTVLTKSLDASDKDAMDVAAHHADNVSPDNAGMGWTFIYGMIPESIRFKLGLSLMPK